MKYIIEQDSHWRVRIKIRGKKRLDTSFKFGGSLSKGAALICARRYRNKILKKINELSRLDFVKSPDFRASKKKINPIIGVYKTSTTAGENWTARMVSNQQEIKRHFSIAKYGNKSAFLKASNVRFFYCGCLIVINKKALPCKPKAEHIFRSAGT